MDKDTVNALKDVLKEELNPIKEDISAIRQQQEENTKFIRSLLSNSETHGATLEKVENKLAHLEGEIKNTRARASLALDNAALNRTDISKLSK